jgi:Protein of unknown function (DUF3093)
MPSYDERLRVPWWWWAVGGVLVFGVFVVYLVWTSQELAATVGLVLVALLVLGLSAYGNVQVLVDEHGLRAGRALLPATSIGEVRTVDGQGRRRLLGPEADARAHTLVRGYVPGGVYVQIRHTAADATPYWFVSSRHPGKLAAALNGTAATTR